MHIVHLVTRLLRGGSEENTIETCRWQAATGHRVTLIYGECDPAWWDVIPGGVTLLRVPELVHAVEPLMDMRAIRALRTQYRRLRPDVIHTHQSKAGVLGRLAADAAPGAFVVHGIHIVPFQGVSTARRAVYLMAERLAARRTDLYITVTRAAGQAYVDAGLARPDQVACVRSGMRLLQFQNADWPWDWRELLRLFPGAQKPPVALMLAALEPRKRHGAFLEGFAKVAAALPEMRLILAGQGPLADTLRAQLRELKLDRQVILCGYRADPGALLALADLTVLASCREGLPRVVVQSLAAGRPVLANVLPGMAEILRDGQNGLLLPPEDTDGLAAHMVALLRDPDGLARLQRGAAATDVSAWNLDDLGQRTTALYRIAGRRVA